MKNNFWQTLGKAVSALLVWGAVTAILLTASCAHQKVPVVLVNMTGVLGQTTCDSSGNTVVLVNMADPARANAYGVEYITLHEQIHVSQIQKIHIAQIKREGDCRAFMRKYNEDKNFAFQMEAEAYCGELEFRVLKGWDRNQLWTSLVAHFKGLYDWLTVEQIVEKLPCQGEKPQRK